ncbi:hypothetical protein C8T65DRAFT_161884 [Cerioporus squamosus]|nr:hypothetical protein C8T65DRAFT_161884 [Cerioporus squamosus]
MDGIAHVFSLYIIGSLGSLLANAMPSHRSSQVSPRVAAVRDAFSAVNVTVDDEHGDQNTGRVPRYLPNGAWAQGAQCGSCALNSAYIDPGRVMDASWHDSTYHPGNDTREISIDFLGTAVYVYHIIVNLPPSPEVTVFTNLAFFIDNMTVGSYTHRPDPDAPHVLYNVPVYVNESLTNEQHTLQIQSGGPNDALILFDYIQYTARSLQFPGQVPVLRRATLHHHQNPLPLHRPRSHSLRLLQRGR